MERIRKRLAIFAVATAAAVSLMWLGTTLFRSWIWDHPRWESTDYRTWIQQGGKYQNQFFPLVIRDRERDDSVRGMAWEQVLKKYPNAEVRTDSGLIAPSAARAGDELVLNPGDGWPLVVRFHEGVAVELLIMKG